MLNFCKCGCGLKCYKQKQYHGRHAPKNNLCACKCGQLCKNKFVNGHNARGTHIGLGRIPSVSARENISAALTGTHRSEKTKALISAGNKGKIRTEEVRKQNSVSHIGVMKGRIPWNKGKTKDTDVRLLAMSNIAKNNYIKNGDKIVIAQMKRKWTKFPYIFADGTIIKMRSSWEVLYAKHLDELGIAWIYEPRFFKLSNGHRYTPDFYLPRYDEYHEVKGCMYPQDREKISLFTKDYPDKHLMVIMNIPKFIKDNIATLYFTFYAKEKQ